MTSVADVRDAERSLVMGYVPAAARAGVAALLALDDTLARIVRTTREPIVGQMRLTWWYEALTALDAAPAPAEPVLAGVAAHVLPRGLAGASLADMADGWEALLGGDALDDEALWSFAAGRGAGLFRSVAGVLGGPDFPPLAPAGEGWALADLSRHVTDAGQAMAARTLAADRLGSVFAHRWPVALRPLGMLAHLALDDVRRPESRPGSPRRLARVAMHRIWGR